MNFSRTRIMMFGAVTCLSSTVMLAQMDSMAVTASATQANQPGQQQPSSTSMQDLGPNAGDVGQIMKDKMFLRGATEDDIAEVKLGQLALEKSPSDDVKAFGQKMVDDHTKLNGNLAPVADSMGVMLPKEMNKADQAEYDKLKGMSGSDFDTAYLTLMMKGNHKAMRSFRMEANSVRDPALSAAVASGESIIHEHLVLVNKLAIEKGIPMPTRGDKPTAPPSPPSPPPSPSAS